MDSSLDGPVYIPPDDDVMEGSLIINEDFAGHARNTAK